MDSFRCTYTFYLHFSVRLTNGLDSHLLMCLSRSTPYFIDFIATSINRNFIFLSFKNAIFTGQSHLALTFSLERNKILGSYLQVPLIKHVPSTFFCRLLQNKFKRDGHACLLHLLIIINNSIIRKSRISTWILC